MKIHSLLILNDRGVCLYSRFFTEEFRNIDINLITPFFSALFAFSERTISRKLQELEMSGLRFLFHMDEQREFIFVLMTDSSLSLLFSLTRMLKIQDLFNRVYDQIEDKLKDYKEFENERFNNLVDAIITGEEEAFKTQTLNQKIIDLFKQLIFEDEILGAGLLSTKGNIIYSSLPNDILLGSIKELEIRFMSGALNLPEMYYSLENGQKVFSKIITHEKSGISFFVVLLYDKTVPLGMAGIKLDAVSKQIEKLLKIYAYK